MLTHRLRSLRRASLGLALTLARQRCPYLIGKAPARQEVIRDARTHIPQLLLEPVQEARDAAGAEFLEATVVKLRVQLTDSPQRLGRLIVSDGGEVGL